MGDDGDAAGELRGFVEVVRREQDRRAVPLQRADEFPEHPPGLRVEARRGFVEEQQLGAPDDAERDVDATLLAAGELRDAGAGLRRQADGGDDLVDVAGARVVAGELPQLLAHREHPRLSRRLQHDADALPPAAVGAPRIGAEDAHVSRRAVPVPLEDLDRRGLTGPVGPEEREGLAALDVEGEPGHGHAIAVGLAQVADPHRWFCHGSSVRPARPGRQPSSGGAPIPRSGEGRRSASTTSPTV